MQPQKLITLGNGGHGIYSKASNAEILSLLKPGTLRSAEEIVDLWLADRLPTYRGFIVADGAIFDLNWLYLTRIGQNACINHYTKIDDAQKESHEGMLVKLMGEQPHEMDVNNKVETNPVRNISSLVDTVMQSICEGVFRPDASYISGIAKSSPKIDLRKINFDFETNLYSTLGISTSGPIVLNQDEMNLMQHLYGAGRLDKVMQRLGEEGIKEIKLTLLNPEFVMSVTKDGPIAAICQFGPSQLWTHYGTTVIEARGIPMMGEPVDMLKAIGPDTAYIRGKTGKIFIHDVPLQT